MTREIARWPTAGEPSSAGGMEYDIRASIAEVTADGPFSTFPGYRRWSVLLGAPIELAGQRLVAVGDVLEVDGDTPLAAHLLAGPTTLLNIVARRGSRVGVGDVPAGARFAFELATRRAILEPAACGRAAWIG